MTPKLITKSTVVGVDSSQIVGLILGVGLTPAISIQLASMGYTAVLFEYDLGNGNMYYFTQIDVIRIVLGIVLALFGGKIAPAVRWVGIGILVFAFGNEVAELMGHGIG